MNMSSTEVDYRVSDINQRIRDMVSTNRSINNINLHRNAGAALGRIQLVGPYTAPLRRANQSPAQRNNPLEKIKIVSKDRLEELCPDDCAICNENPKIKDSICTECNHYFCKSCWNEWMNSESGNKKCPTCRKDMPRVTSFKARTSKKLTGPMTQPLRDLIIED